MLNSYIMVSYKNPKLLFHGKRVDLLEIETTLPSGKVIKKEVVDHPGAVVILPFLDEKTIILIQNRREIVQETLWELPAGTLEKNEKPLACAKRELEEETGYTSENLKELFDFYSTPGFCNEKLTIFVAKGLKKTQQKLDESENIEVFPLPLDKALEMIQKKIIRDGKTIASLLYYSSFT